MGKQQTRQRKGAAQRQRGGGGGGAADTHAPPAGAVGGTSGGGVADDTASHGAALADDAGVSWADVKLFFFTWAALVALFGLGGYLLYEDEYQRQLQDHLMNKGLTSATEGRWEEAIASYTAVLDKDREHTVALTNRGMAYSKTGQDTEAMLDFTASLAAASGRQDVSNRMRTLYNRGLVYIRLNFLKEALSDLSEVLEKSPREYADAFTQRGTVYTLQVSAAAEARHCPVGASRVKGSPGQGKGGGGGGRMRTAGQQPCAVCAPRYVPGLYLAALASSHLGIVA
jgi:hypothetical protein